MRKLDRARLLLAKLPSMVLQSQEKNKQLESTLFSLLLKLTTTWTPESALIRTAWVRRTNAARISPLHQGKSE